MVKCFFFFETGNNEEIALRKISRKKEKQNQASLHLSQSLSLLQAFFLFTNRNRPSLASTRALLVVKAEREETAREVSSRS
jgi:hypothetical protein